MGKTIVFASGGKGGVGKSGTAVNLCGALAQKGHRVALVDTDTGLKEQGNNGTRTASNWCAARNYLLENGSLSGEVISYMLSPEEKIHRQLRELAAVNDYVVVDTPGAANTALKSAISVADIVYLPINCTRVEFVPLQAFFSLLDDLEDLLAASGNEKLIDARILPSRIPGNWRLDNTEFKNWFEENAQQYVSLSGVNIPFIKAMAESVGEGWSLHDAKNSKRAVFDLLVDEINGERNVRVERALQCEGRA